MKAWAFPTFELFVQNKVVIFADGMVDRLHMACNQEKNHQMERL